MAMPRRPAETSNLAVECEREAGCEVDLNQGQWQSCAAESKDNQACLYLNILFILDFLAYILLFGTSIYFVWMVSASTFVILVLLLGFNLVPQIFRCENQRKRAPRDPSRVTWRIKGTMDSSLLLGWHFPTLPAS